MRILAIVHEPDAGPGTFGQAAADAGHQLELWRPAEEKPPPVGPYAALMTFGGGMHPDQVDTHPWLGEEKRLLRHAVEEEKPLLAVCLGAELLADALGETPYRASIPEIGWVSVCLTEEAGHDPLLEGMGPTFTALEWHSYATPLPRGATPLAQSQTCLQAYRVGRTAWGLQFHAEVTLRDFESWLDRFDEDPDAMALGIKPAQLRGQTRASIGEWNRFGYELCRRFLRFAAGWDHGCRKGPPGNQKQIQTWRN